MHPTTLAAAPGHTPLRVRPSGANGDATHAAQPWRYVPTQLSLLDVLAGEVPA